MTQPAPADPAADVRRAAYLLLAAAAVAVAAARVAGAENVFEPSRYKPAAVDGYGREPDRVWPAARPEPAPTFSSNDKSRWATVRALVDEGTYVIGRRVNHRETEKSADGGKTGYADEGILFLNDYRSLDVVMDPETGLFYSSKPPLFPTLLAGEYWLFKSLVGWDIDRDRWPVMATILFTVNVLPFAVYLLLLAKLIERLPAGDFARLFAFAAACFGTFVVTFAGTLNNHTPAVYCVLFAVYPLLAARLDGRPETARDLAVSGFFGGLAFTLELPAAALVAGLAAPLLVARPRLTLLAFVPAALVPVAGLALTNYLAMGHVKPVYGEFGGPWYNYPGSHWAKWGTPAARGIDFNREPTTVYAFHLLFGHHGWFSLTPVWLVGLAGLAGLAAKAGPSARAVFARGDDRARAVWTPQLLAALTLAVSAVVFAFYLSRTNSYNYGGNTSGPRWLFWLTPLWLLAVPAGADRLGRSRAGRLAAAALLGFAAFAAFYPQANPWRNPWVLQLLEYVGAVRY